MQLGAVTIEGFRRFRSETTLRASARVVALVGPNEAGKTSILKALVRTNDRDPWADSDRPLGIKASEWKGADVTLRYALDKGDRAALESVPEAKSLAYYLVRKHRDGSITHDSQPRVRRDVAVAATLRRRTEAVARSVGGELRDAKRETRVAELMSLNDALRDLDALSESVFDHGDSLDASDSDLLNEIRARVSAIPARAKAASRDLLTAIDRAIDYYAADSEPSKKALNLLWKRRPAFELFDSSPERRLAGSYSLDALREAVPPALADLLVLAELDISDLLEADGPERIDLVAGANRRIEAVLIDYWQQSPVTLELDINGGQLDIHPLSVEANRRTRLDDRSDGFRSFLSLVTFVCARGDEVPPILLIDEAERNLHYDAQAQLVRAFYELTVAAKVVYSTHSVGCLPEDLGSAVRVVAPVGHWDSAVRNGFWTEAAAGVATALAGMGAATLALSALDKCVLVEGPSDATLLPALLRAARDLESYVPLGYRVIPGVANNAGEQLKRLTTNALRTALVVDGDSDGTRYVETLAPILGSERCLQLGVHGIEDLIDAEVFETALERVEPALKNPPRSGRSQWLKRNGVQKSRLAEATLTTAEDIGRPVLAHVHRPEMRRIAASLERLLRDPV